MLPGRAVDDDEWMTRARALVDAGRAALLAAQKRDPEAVMSTGELITNACDACHQKYWDDNDAASE
jgi:cytochrome c556